MKVVDNSLVLTFTAALFSISNYTHLGFVLERLSKSLSGICPSTCGQSQPRQFPVRGGVDLSLDWIPALSLLNLTPCAVATSLSMVLQVLII
jgi:hypothetical protein